MKIKHKSYIKFFLVVLFKWYVIDQIRKYVKIEIMPADQKVQPINSKCQNDALKMWF